MMAGKRKKKKKSRCSNDGDFGLRGRRYWRDENDGDSVPMTETQSWQVWNSIFNIDIFVAELPGDNGDTILAL